MTETVVRVTTLEQWKAVLDVWFKKGYKWYSGDKDYHAEYFKSGSRELLLNKDNDILVPTPGKREPISYKEFMEQQKEGNKMETVVQVSTLKQWKEVLDVWFKKGYNWTCSSMRNDYQEEMYWEGSRQLGFNVRGHAEISYWSLNDYTGDNLIEYSDFMEQQKGGNKMETYYVTQEQYDLIEELKQRTFPIDWLILDSDGYFRPLTIRLTSDEAKALLRHLGGDETIEFKVKETLYRLWRSVDYDDNAYMKFTSSGTPDWTINKYDAFTAPLEEIKKHKTISWNIEEAD